MTMHENAGRAGNALHELAVATAGLLGEQDVIGMTSSLLAGCSRATGAAAAGLVVARPDDRRLELLASTSHRAEQIELYQLQADEGACVDAVKTLEPVTVVGSAQIADRWPTVVRAFAAAGYTAVHAVPMIWHGEALGAVNLFFVDGGSIDEISEIAQAFADVAVVAIVHSGRVTAQDVVARSRAALDQRIVIERAKGVIAYAGNVPTDEAFDLLLALAGSSGRPLGEVAGQLIDHAVSTN
ncbi:GAF and ANTAR domain-containing protein [Kribbella qitaiheensis]|uniref:GAF and ANTAR domain-containing protein n=1 Tax=Kribbella qitaiheensis TaxID=1544730 RepID=A0A7G6WS68_9ACTN|nr:GAF and ANTAR domain-containing protein [Kribbella qitaiheensis]QNE16833.1 GAF and ANTAR domain-containing protein [Kribbella qitaiheensis]